MRVFSPFFWKRVRRFIARVPHSFFYLSFLVFIFVILSIFNSKEYFKRTALNQHVLPLNASETEQGWVEEKLSSFSPQDKIKQLFIWGIADSISSESAVLWKERAPGGFLITGTFDQNKLASITASIQSLNLKVPPFIAIDEEGGIVKRVIDDPNPGAFTLRQSSDEEICKTWELTDTILHDTGITLNFGIIGDIGWKKDVYIYPRSFSASPSAVARYVALSIGCHKTVTPVVKHFPGHGRTVVDSHFGIPHISITESEWNTSDAMPFQVAIENNSPMIMVGHLLFDKIASEPASLSPFWIQKLRNIGFDRIIITDNLAMLTSSGYRLNESTKQAFMAGNDMLLISSLYMNPEEILESLYSLATSSSDMIQSLDDRVGRILHEKYLLKTHFVP